MLSLNHTANMYIFANGSMNQQRFVIDDELFVRLLAGLMLLRSLVVIIGDLSIIYQNTFDLLSFTGTVLGIRISSLAWGFFG